MITTKYRPKRMQVRPQDLNFIPSYVQFFQWNAEKREFEPAGTLHWTGEQWEPFGAIDKHFYTMHYLVTTERTFGNSVYNSRDIDFYKPFYYVPSTGTKVEVDYAPPLLRPAANSQMSPDLEDDIETSFNS
jgi:hypothetical protein